jgi:hypothetical protein
LKFGIGGSFKVQDFRQFKDDPPPLRFDTAARSAGMEDLLSAQKLRCCFCKRAAIAQFIYGIPLKRGFFPLVYELQWRQGNTQASRV